MKKKYYNLLILLFISIPFISCESPQEIVPTGIKSASEAPSDGSSPRSFILDITGGSYSVGIVNKFTEPPKITIVTTAMCPYTYFYEIPSRIVTPKVDDIEIIATNSSMRYIRGFCDDYSCYSHADTYHYAVFWNGSQHIKAVFDPTNWRPDPLPIGIDDGGTSGIKPDYADVSITIEAKDINVNASYVDKHGNSIYTPIAGVTLLSSIRTKEGVSLDIHNITRNTIKIYFYNGSNTSDAQISPWGSMTTTLKPTSANYHYRIY